MAVNLLAEPVRSSAATDCGEVVSWTMLGRGFPLIVCSPSALPFSFWEPVLRSIADHFHVIFVHPRGLWETPLPRDLRAVGVDDHARDVAFVVARLALQPYGMLGHCIGAAPIVASFPLLEHLPQRVLLVSNRFSPGPTTANLDKVIERTRRDERFRHQYTQVAAAYAPPEIRRAVEQELDDLDELEAHLRAIQSARSYAYRDPWPQAVGAWLATAAEDSEAITASTEAFALRLGGACVEITRLPGGHCALQQDRAAGHHLISQAFAPFTDQRTSRADATDDSR